MNFFITRYPLLLLVFCLITAVSYSQEAIYQDDAVLQFDQEAFDGRFCVLAEVADENNYYVTDLTSFPDRFSRIYFLNLVYEEKMVVNIDARIDHDQMWFKSSTVFTENEVVCRMDELLEETLDTSSGMTGSQKAAWLGKHDKFNKKNSKDETK